ncbi:PRELI-like family-domain-containing protein [Syncephalis pseudoplumigaleata]|uniref:PRELI-like family-domain-containing protein n=1 Tax=Syncephalis pseudoplumigaleata TaxID=1712513 RepID=A0A4P9Z4Z4_9FUNG|nr:PRELI-like family-domain-containing protein [Syncephalis pseudoplumigaleata]|eukprot:RKP27674.1 PRELI-like family-domain-containing protein [Syncephalis pseudoplumigaleata]
MVKFFQYAFRYDHTWEDVTLAFFLRYPNPHARHVLAADILDQHVDPATGNLHTTRLLLKKGMVPKWGNKLVKNNQAYILEESITDPKQGVMTTRTRNITHKRLMYIEETQQFRVHPENRSWTQAKCEARIMSNIGWGMTSRIEGFGLKRFTDNTAKSRQGMKWVLEMLRGQHHMPATMSQ